jgi:pre-mRNA 3'-end-processing factor FIP1
MASDHEDEDDDLYGTAIEAKIDNKHLKDEDEASSGDEPMDEGADSGDDEEDDDDDDDSESVSQP